MLDKLRKELLNLTLNNNLLKLREFKARGLTVKNIDSEELLQKLVEELKGGVFLSDGMKDSNTRNVFHLPTNYPEKELEKRLLGTYSEAKAFIEERGINALYITLGALKWYEDDNSDIEILSPLLLVPVQLERIVMNGETTFKLKYNEEAIEPNYTLERKMEVDFGIKLPPFDENESITTYFNNIYDTVKNKKKWAVIPNEIRVNLFSFLKLMMYHDLDDSRWDENCKPSDNFLIKNLLNNFGNLLFDNGSDSEKFQFDNLSISDIDHILDADSSQAEAIERVFKNKYLVIKGPPGTGKSQTIANIIASCIKKGKTVLFVSEKLAALEVVKNRLEKSGLGAACLELHSYKANRREILESIKQTLEQKTQQNVRDRGELLQLEDTRRQLNEYYSALFEPIEKSEITPYQAIGEIIKVKQSFPDITYLDVTDIKWTRAEIRQREDYIKSVCDFVSQNGHPRNSPFWGVGKLGIGLVDVEKLKAESVILKNTLIEILESAKRLAHILEIEYPNNLSEIKQLLKTAQLLLDNPGINGINKEFNERSISQEDIKSLFQLGENFHKIKEDYKDKLLIDAHKQNFHRVKLIYETKGKTWLRFIYSDFRQSQKQLLDVLKIKPSSISEEIDLVTVLVNKSMMVEKSITLKNVAKEIFTEGGDWDFENDKRWLDKKSGIRIPFMILK